MESRGSRGDGDGTGGQWVTGEAWLGTHVLGQLLGFL